MTFLFGVFFGIVIAFIAVVLFSTYLANKALKKEENKIKAKMDLEEKVRPLLDRIHEITDEQLQLKANSEQPSRNAVHSKYKNSLIARFKSLDEEKTQLLTKVVEMGYDPMITVSDEYGGQESIKLSEHLANLGIVIGKKEEKQEVKEKPKFYVVKNEDDGASN